MKAPILALLLASPLLAQQVPSGTAAGQPPAAGSPAARAAALNALKHFNDPRLAEAVTTAGASDSADLRGAALHLIAGHSPDRAAPVIKNRVTNGDIEEKRTALAALAVLKHPEADALMVAQLD